MSTITAKEWLLKHKSDLQNNNIKKVMSDWDNADSSEFAYITGSGDEYFSVFKILYTAIGPDVFRGFNEVSKEMFYGWQESDGIINKLVVPNNVKIIKAGAFERCESFKNIELKGVIKINSNAFNDTTTDNLILPDTIKEVDYNAFYCFGGTITCNQRVKDLIMQSVNDDWELRYLDWNIK